MSILCGIILKVVKVKVKVGSDVKRTVFFVQIDANYLSSHTLLHGLTSDDEEDLGRAATGG